MRSIPDALSVTQSPTRRRADSPPLSPRTSMSRVRRAVIGASLLAVMALGLAAAPSLAHSAHLAHTVAPVLHSMTAHVKPFGGCQGTPAPC